ncbi:bacteriophage antitermination protein Q [Serratia sp. PAMC26656]|uniref:bacteriophage antitermination protein Q n=1 Tax=Serratia sp. PAMC26656 TaxID=2775909 RepID=UPI001F29B858|nr:bacteriophage antitermination protein Q [Serratia sp. PAMC26656]
MIVTQQYLQYIRESFMMATADLSGKTKGQLQAFTESTQVSTTRVKRKRRTIVEPDGTRIVVHSNPVPGTETRPSSGAIALIEPETFLATSWRRAVYPLNGHQRSWLAWCYTGDLAFSHQVEITQWAWSEFKAGIEGKKIAGKTIERLRALIWLAAQDVRSETIGGEVYQLQDVAALLQVSPPNWSKNYNPYWTLMRGIFRSLDRDGLLALSRSRSQQKSTFSQQGIAKVN